MKRRAFITLLGGAAAWPLAARAQQGERMWRIGILASLPLPSLQRFARKLSEYGYNEGQNLRLVSRFAEGRDDRYPAMAAELAALPVDLIVTMGTPAALAAKQATRTIPIVMGAIGDPVSVGVVSNLARPDGNITGFAAQNLDLEGKRLELLKELVPHLSRVGMLANAANPLLDVSLQKLRPAAERLRITIDLFDIRSRDEIDAAFIAAGPGAARWSSGRARPSPADPPTGDRGGSGKEQASSSLPVSRICRWRRSRHPWRQSGHFVRACSGLRRQDSEGRQACRSTGAAGD